MRGRVWLDDCLDGGLWKGLLALTVVRWLPWFERDARA